MNTGFILFFIALGIGLLYLLFIIIDESRRFNALKTRLPAEHCPKCRQVFGPSMIPTKQEFHGFIDPAPDDPLLQIICPHCRVVWDYCDGSYTESGSRNMTHPFFLDREGHEKCGELLAAAGMQFIEQRRESVSRGAVVFAELISPHGTFRCNLVSSPGHNVFCVTIHGHGKAASPVLVDIERAFLGHLVGKH